MLPSRLSSAFLLLFASTILLAGPSASAQETASFSDVPPSHSAFQAIEYLKEKGVLAGYSDGTFKPNTKVNRAESVKIIIAAMVRQEELDTMKVSPYTDVADGVWYLPYVEIARTKFVMIDGPPKALTFAPTRAVKLAEFLKMFFIAKGMDYKGSYAELTLPLAADVRSSTEWYFPLMRAALSTSMISVDAAGSLGAARELTRANVAELLYFYDMYRENRRAQALLSQTENDLVNILTMLENQQIEEAEFASARAIVSARGALAIRPTEGLVKGAMKTAEGFQKLVFAYRAGLGGEYQKAVDLAKEAWGLAERAKGFSSELTIIATQMQTIAKNIADEARAAMAAMAES